MKKTFLLIGCLLVLALGITTISCKKDKKEDSEGCTCTMKYDGKNFEGGTFKVPAEELEGMSCSELTDAIWSELEDMTLEELANELGVDPGQIPEDLLDRLDINCK